MLTRDQANQVVAAIVRDLRDRRGLKQEWEAIDPETKLEIVDTWTNLVLVGASPKESHNAVD